MERLLAYSIVQGAGQWLEEKEEAKEATASASSVLSAGSSDTIALLSGEGRKLADGELRFAMTPLSLAGRVGAIIRYASAQSWIFIGCDTPMDPFGRSTWIWALPDGKQGVLFKSDPLYEDHRYELLIRYAGTVLTVILNGYEVYHGTIPELSTVQSSGIVGFRAWCAEDGSGDGHARISDVSEREIDAQKYLPQRQAEDGADTESWTLSSEQLSVEVDAAFPRVLGYRWLASGAVLHGQEERLQYVDLNNERYEPLVTAEQRSAASAAYSLLFPELKVEMVAVVTISGASLELQITDIREQGEFRIRTIALPNHGLVSVRDTQEGAAVALAEGIKGDTFAAAADLEPEAAPAYKAIAIIHTAELAASVIGNSLNNRRRLCVQTVQRSGYKQTALWHGYWTYRGPDMRIIGEPWAKVVVTADRNGDGLVDWQDGAIAVREALPPIPGAETLRGSYAHIAMNFGSLAQFPFLRILDNVKKLHLYTDGFGQMLELKGYQSEGHDSGHPDYGNNFNERAGGLRDLNLLAARARDYGAVIGVHINHSEAYPEARSYSSSLVTTTPGWRWMDQSYYIDREADILSGNFDKRLDELKEQAPNLGFIYVDTYRDEHWAAWRLVEKLRGLGYTIWTEEADALDSDAVWTHDSTGDSVISRFIRHQDKDAYAEDVLLKGGYERYGDNGFMGWQNERDLTAVVRAFYTKQLPYRYLMHFALMKWTPSVEAVLEGGVISRIEDGAAVIRKDGRLIARGDTVFIPWDPIHESKIYHWNAEGGETKWELPAHWCRNGSAKLYRLTSLGRVHAQDVEVIAGMVTLTVEANTPYVLYQEEAAPNPKIVWGEGSPVKDMGFDSHSFEWWTKSSNSGNTGHIEIAATSYGQSYLSICGNNGADALVEQGLEGLNPGATYSASVWVQVSDGRRAALRINGCDGETKVHEIDRTAVINWDPDSDKRGTYYQRLQVRFQAPQHVDSLPPKLSLVADQGDAESYVHFDDVRVCVIGASDEAADPYYEDFEQVDAGWGPFVSAQPKVNKTHLSQRHEGCTDDTIEGEWSLKTLDQVTGELLRTLPSTVRLLPNSIYRLSFHYKAEHEGQYSILVRTQDGGAEQDLTTEPLRQGQHDWQAEVTTGAYSDYYIAIMRHDSSPGSLVIDKFAVSRMGEIQ